MDHQSTGTSGSVNPLDVFAQRAYNAYRESNKSHADSKHLLMSWDDLGELTREDWRQATRAVINHLTKFMG